jgi:hypothetical protein
MFVLRARAIAAIVTCAACGPVSYVGEVTRHASDALEAARAAQADKYAPYWWTRATEYLHEARALAAHADFQGANRFGKLAADAADHAAAEAALAAHDPRRRDADVAPAKDAPAPVAPAKDER